VAPWAESKFDDLVKPQTTKSMTLLHFGDGTQAENKLIAAEAAPMIADR